MSNLATHLGAADEEHDRVNGELGVDDEVADEHGPRREAEPVQTDDEHRGNVHEKVDERVDERRDRGTLEPLQLAEPHVRARPVLSFFFVRKQKKKGVHSFLLSVKPRRSRESGGKIPWATDRNTAQNKQKHTRRLKTMELNFAINFCVGPLCYNFKHRFSCQPSSSVSGGGHIASKRL